MTILFIITVKYFFADDIFDAEIDSGKDGSSKENVRAFNILAIQLHL